MRAGWTQDYLVEHRTLAPGEHLLLMNKSGPGRLGFRGSIEVLSGRGLLSNDHERCA